LSDKRIFKCLNFKRIPYKAILGFENLSEKCLELKASSGIDNKTAQSYKNFINRAITKWGNRNIKTISSGDIDDLLLDRNWLTPQGKIVKKIKLGTI